MNPILIQNNNVDSCTIFFLFNVGSINENNEISGVSHFIEHMVFKGNKNIPKSNDLLRKLDSIGGDYNAFTTNNLTGFHIKIMKQFQLEAFKIMYDMLFLSNFNDIDIDIEREVIKEEYHKDRNDYSTIIEEKTQKTVLRGTPYSKSIIGTLTTINNIKKKELIQYWKKYYNIENCVIMLNGNIDIRLIENIKKLNLKHYPFNYLEYKITENKKPIIEIINGDKNHTELSISFKTCGMINNDKYTIDLISNILGGNMSSRLFLSLREKYGIVYEIDCENTFFRDVGYLQINCSFDNKNILNTIHIILEEIKIIKNEYIQKKEMIDNINYLKSMELLSKEDTLSICEDISTEYILTGKINLPNKNIEHYNNINKYNIKKVSKEIFTKNNINIIIVGNYKKDILTKKINHIISKF